MDKSKTIAALFDFDGVVMDTETQYSLFWGEQGRKYHPEITDFNVQIKGTTLVQIFDRFFVGMTEIQEIIRRDLYQFEKEMTYNYIPGVLDFITDLRKHGVKMAVVTSSDEAKMEHVYRAHTELKDLFDCILTSEMFAKSKPDPECFLLGAEVLGATPDDSFVFEDSFHGLKAGNRAGMTVIGLATTNLRERIRDKATLVIDDFRDFTYGKLMALAND